MAGAPSVLTRPTFLLLLGFAGVSSASLWIRLSDDSSAELAFRRLCLALPAILVWARASGSPIVPPSRGRGRLLLAGVLLALHFHAWIASLAHLSVATSVLLVTLHPVMVYVVEVVRGQLALGWRPVLGLVLAIAGVALLPAGGAGVAGGSFWRGVLLALGGAAAMAGYLLAGRSLRKELTTATYVLAVYGIALLVLFGVVLADGGAPLPTSGHEWWLAGALALFPTLLGHTPMNAALARLPATVVSISFVAEAFGAALLVWLVLGEVPPPGTFIGGVGIVAGIIITARYAAPS